MVVQSRGMSLTWTPPSFPRQKTAVHENTAKYAAINHEGGQLRNGGVIQPRPWMRSAYLGPYGDYDAVQEFADTYRRTGSIATAFQATAVGANNIMRQLIRFDGWPYDATTKRKNKTIVGPPRRNIVDLGGILEGQQPVRCR